MKTSMNVMLLAAGEGLRLRPFTLSVPKPAIPFLSVPLAAYSLALLDGVKIQNLVVNTHHLPDQVEKLFFELFPECRELIYSFEPQLLGSGGGIHNAKKSLLGEDNFLVMNADEVILPMNPFLIDDLITAHQAYGGVATLLTMSHPEVGKKFGGAWTIEGNQVSLFSKTSPGNQYRGHHFIGPMILNDRVFRYFKDQVEVENILYETLSKAMDNGEKVYVHNVDCLWEETGNPTDFLAATGTCLQLLKENPSHPGAEFLKACIGRFGGREPVIEKEEPKLLQALAELRY